MIANLAMLPFLLILSSTTSAPEQRSNPDNTVLKQMEPARNILNVTLSHIMTRWTDVVLEAARAIMVAKGLTEFPLPPEEFEFSQKVLGVNWHGEASVYDRLLRGLQTIHRTGPVGIYIEPKSGDMISDIELGVENTSVKARATAKFMNMGPTANITGSFDMVRLKMGVRVSMHLSGIHTRLDGFEITDLGRLSMEVKGFGGMMNFLAEIIAGTLGNSFKQELRKLLEVKVREIIEDTVAHPPSVPNIVSLLQASSTNALRTN